MASEAGRRRRIDAWAVAAGLVVGLMVIVPIFAIQLALVVGSDDPASAWIALLLGGFLVAFGLAGHQAARQAPGRPLAHGAWAGTAVLAAWIPLRLVVAAVGDGENPLAGVVSGAALAVLAGMVGAVVAIRRERRTG